MNSGFSEFLRAAPRDRRDVFLGAANRLGTPEQKVEKDFWVTWTLDALFNGLPAGHPRFLFKGGTSLSKAYGLISRFSEDIDITVFREDIGHAASVLELEGLSRKKRQFKLEAIKNTICFGTDTQSEKAAVISSERISERIVLSLEFFKDILDHPIPTDMAAAKALSCSPAALNLFTWLSYRCWLDLVRALWRFGEVLAELEAENRTRGKGFIIAGGNWAAGSCNVRVRYPGWGRLFRILRSPRSS
ncbi:MAG TPA: nucleotidyl transferase AbiEii/AbiGii toxin family protein [Terracidiphilus sp.]